MRGCKFLVLLLILIDLIFAQTKALDSTNIISLNKQKLFFATGDNWIPPTIPNESCFFSAGCCLMPLTGCLIGRELINREKMPSDSATQSENSILGIGIGYSPGIAYRGVLSRHLESGEMDPFHKFYWNNQVSINLTLPVSKVVFTKLITSYIWARMEDTGTPFLPIGGYFCPDDKWEFDGYSFTFSTGYQLKQNEAAQVEMGIGYYLWEGTNYVIKAYTFEPVTITNWGKGFYGIFNLGIKTYVIKNLAGNISLTMKYSRGKEEGYSASEPVEQLTPVVFYLTGVYLVFGIEYVFKGKKEVKND